MLVKIKTSNNVKKHLSQDIQLFFCIYVVVVKFIKFNYHVFEVQNFLNLLALATFKWPNYRLSNLKTGVYYFYFYRIFNKAQYAALFRIVFLLPIIHITCISNSFKILCVAIDSTVVNIKTVRKFFCKTYSCTSCNLQA